MTIHITSRCTVVSSKEINAHSIFTPNTQMVVVFGVKRQMQRPMKRSTSLLIYAVCFFFFFSHTTYIFSNYSSTQQTPSPIYEAAYFSQARYNFSLLLLLSAEKRHGI